MTGERDKDSVLFKIDDVAKQQSAAVPEPVAEESSGLVDIKSALAAETKESPVAAVAPAKRDSSGLVDINKLLAEEEANKAAAVTPSLVPPKPAVDASRQVVATPRATIPTPMLVAVIVALAATIGVLVWKLV